MPPERSADHDDRLDKLLAAWPDVGSRRRARDAIQTGKVLVAGAVCRDPGQQVAAGTLIEVQWNRPGTAKDRQKGERELRAAGLRILHEDAALIAVDKPPGLLTDTASQEQHRTRDSVAKRLRAYLRASGDRPRTVHRIDRDTSGVVLFAKNDAAERPLREAFRNHRPERIYLALVLGKPSFEETTWEDHTRWNPRARVLARVPEEAEGSRATRCDVRVRRQFGDRAAELEVRLDTGRRNQIRLQAQLRNHPLLGERLYVEEAARRRLRELPPAPRQMLHASRLWVRHPSTSEPLALLAPLPADYKKLTRQLRAKP